MKRFLKWLLIIVGSAVGLVLVLGLTIFLRGQSRIDESMEVAGHDIRIPPADSLLIARGKHLATISNCNECHGQRFDGTLLVDDEAFGKISAPNLTSGEGGVGGVYSVRDWERAIRHGVAKDGRPILVMPTSYFQHYSDADLEALIAYLQTIPPVDHDASERAPGPVAKMLVGAGQYVPPAFEIDHDAPHEAAPPEGATAVYGKYITYIAHCGDCHGQDFKGQTMEGPPQGPDISRTGNPGQWSESEFFTAIRTGATPDGRNLDPTQMPWPRLATMSDTELQAVWQYLETIQ